MPPQLPDRYELEVRLGLDGDVEEWLATDTSLDRPVLIRVLGPGTSETRRAEFLEGVRGAAGVTHTHLASVYAADTLPKGAYSISEWAGGITFEHRMKAGETIPVLEFLPNAAGLAEALAALHTQGILHGSIDAGAILFSVAHPAKLAGFGRHTETGSAGEDVRRLADTLVSAITGAGERDVPPSQMVDGLAPEVDRVLARARSGDLDAAGLAELLRAAPSSVDARRAERGFSWRWIIPAAVLLFAAVVLFTVGRSLDTEPQDPLLFPVTPEAPRIETSTTSSTQPPLVTPVLASITGVEILDPEGDGAEHQREVPNLIDGDPTTTWSTERYNDPLPLIKSGVGFAVGVEGTPGRIELLGAADGMSYRLLWSPVPTVPVDEWEAIAGGSILGGSSSVRVPARTDGYWLVWLTDLPPDPDGGYVGRVGEVRFEP